MKPVELRIADDDFHRLQTHLHRSDRDEHGAVILAGGSEGPERDVLLTREVHLLSDSDFPPGRNGYRQFSAESVAALAGRAGDLGLGYISVHSHPLSTHRTALSRDDLAAHRRLFPHLLDLTAGKPVGGIATGTGSAAGEIWRPSKQPAPLSALRVIGPRLKKLVTGYVDVGEPLPRFDRQARLFGADGQQILRAMRVAVIGAGGGGSILVEQLAHLGVGAIDIFDFDVVQEHNLSRIVGARDPDAKMLRKKVDVAKRHVQEIDPSVKVRAIDGDIADLDVARHLLESDFMFLATDTNTSRLVFNAIAHRYLIPGIQIGAKVEVDETSEVGEVYVAVRPVVPDSGCLYCQEGLIDPMRLQQEARTPEEARAQDYVGDGEVVDPSVITLNGIAASHAANTMLFQAVGLTRGELAQQLFFLRDGTVLNVEARKNPECPFCSRRTESSFAKGDPATDLPVRTSPADRLGTSA